MSLPRRARHTTNARQSTARSACQAQRLCKVEGFKRVTDGSKLYRTRPDGAGGHRVYVEVTRRVNAVCDTIYWQRIPDGPRARAVIAKMEEPGSR